jgi:hypothetical protein
MKTRATSEGTPGGSQLSGTNRCSGAEALTARDSTSSNPRAAGAVNCETTLRAFRAYSISPHLPTSALPRTPLRVRDIGPSSWPTPLARSRSAGVTGLLLGAPPASTVQRTLGLGAFGKRSSGPKMEIRRRDRGRIKNCIPPSVEWSHVVSMTHFPAVRIGKLPPLAASSGGARLDSGAALHRRR